MADEGKTIFIIILIVLIAMGIGYYYNPKVKTTINSISSNLASIINLQTGVDFAGYHWTVSSEGNLQGAPPYGGGASGTYNRGDFITLTSEASGASFSGGSIPSTNFYSYTCMITDEEISNIDEFLIIWTGSGSHSVASGGCASSHAGANVFISLYDKSTQQHRHVRAYPSSIVPETNGAFVFKPELVKFMNNFDGTYTTYSTLGIGDIYIKDKTVSVTDMQSKHLAICAFADASSSTDCGTHSSQSKVLIYNIVTKRLESPICKAGQIPLENGSCENLETILLAHESAIYESLAEKIQRIEDRLADREIWLQGQIDELNLILANENTDEQIRILNSTIEGLIVQLSQKENERLLTIQNLENSITSLKEQLDTAEGASIERITNEIQALQAQLAFEKLASTDEIGMLNDQILFYNSQLSLIEQGTDVRITEVENELKLTKQILDGISSGEITPPPDVDIEEVITKVLQRINAQEQITQRGLTDEEIKSLIDIEMNAQFQERFPGGLTVEDSKSSNLFVYIFIGLAIIIILFAISKKNR